MDDVAPSGLSCLCVFGVGDIAERCPYIYLADFQVVALAGQKDARNERPYIYSPGFQGVAVAGKKDVQNERPYNFAGFQGGAVAGQKDARNERPYIFCWFSGGYGVSDSVLSRRAFCFAPQRYLPVPPDAGTMRWHGIM